MELFVMSVRDIAVDSFGAPFCAVKIEKARRDFGDAVNDDSSRDNKFYLHPEHFELYHLGMWNDETGLFNTFPNPRQICVGSELRKPSRV